MHCLKIQSKLRVSFCVAAGQQHHGNLNVLVADLVMLADGSRYWSMLDLRSGSGLK